MCRRDLLLSALALGLLPCSGLRLLALLRPLVDGTSVNASAELRSDLGGLADDVSDAEFSIGLWLLLSMFSALRFVADGSFPFSGVCLPLLRFTRVSKLNLRSPVCELVWPTALQD